MSRNEIWDGVFIGAFIGAAGGLIVTVLNWILG
jgi:hypothetical protein